MFMYSCIVSTYSDETTTDGRYEIIDECLDSLSRFPQNKTEVVIAADGPLTEKHQNILKKYNFKVISRKENGGISKIKNLSMKYSFSIGANSGLLLDDDVVVKSCHLTEHYCTQMKITGIPHFSYRVEDGDREFIYYNGHPIIKTRLVNGCVISFNKTLIDQVGWFKIMPYKYSHEHTNFTLRCREQNKIPFFCDVIGSHELIHVNHKSWTNTSFNIDRSRITENENSYISDLTKYTPCVD